MSLRKYARVTLLVLILLGSTVAVFGLANPSQPAPTAPANATADDGALNLNYGLDLAGGTRLRAPLVGVTAEGIPAPDDPRAFERRVASRLDDAGPSDVLVRVRTPTNRSEAASAIEVTAENVSQDDLKAALDAENVAYDRVRSGVTEETRAETVRVLNDKINHAGLSGGTARQVSTSDGEHYILIEMPNQRREEVRDLVNQRGKVQVDIYYPTANGTYETRPAVLERDDFRRIGTASSGQRVGPHVPVTLRDGVAERFQQAVVDTGVAASGGSDCAYMAAPNQTGPCLLTKVDGEVVYAAGMSPSLAADMRSGEWTKNPSFILQTANRSEAQELAINLRAGALPAKLDLDEGTSSYVSPAQGEKFRSASLIIGLLAVLAVAGKVFWKYRDLRVAVPMMLTALSEVFILFGVAAVLRYPIDLAVVGGFIAVVGTGVDDLIIITNEVLSKGEVNSRRVFQTRFKRAFWVIGSAAVTTIIAMSPLVVLSLGDLRGFAIFTVIGVIIGVAITRPAYGDILSHLLLDE